jgi:uncharacterized protein YndB with AHSA1/START domain
MLIPENKKASPMYVIKHLFHINAPKERVFEALATIEGLAGWWTNKVTGNASTGGVIEFRFGEYGCPDMKVKDITPNELVVWECVGGPEDWMGHIFFFHLDTNENKTRVRFEHSGWKETGDFYASCNFSWGRYMESLRQLCQTGKGEAFGSEGYRK